MEWQSKYITADIKLSEYSGNAYSTETLFDHHMLVWFISGETRIIRSEGSYVFRAGDIFLIPRNQIATIINSTGDGRPNKSVVMHLTTERSKEFYSHVKPLAPLQVVPGKLDLVGFMERNFIFNLPLEKFARLTGRSLSTFGRDFKKIFQTTPEKWLTQKRLEFAHYQIREKKRKPVDVYLEAGFVDLSHFSYAFKKRFGYSPGEAGV
jgi:AraC-like DNA-binding protein